MGHSIRVLEVHSKLKALAKHNLLPKESSKAIALSIK